MDHTKYAQCIPKQIKRPYIRYIGALNIQDTKIFLGQNFSAVWKDDTILLEATTDKLIVNGRYCNSHSFPKNSIIIKVAENNFNIICNLSEFYEQYDTVTTKWR